MRISIRLPNNSIALFEFHQIHTIHDIKSMLIQSFPNLITNPQLIYYGKLLQDSRTLESYSITTDSDLFLINLDEDVIQVFVQKLMGAIYTIDIKSSFTIQEVKKKIKEVTKIPESHQKLFYKNKVLENENFVNEYGIEPKTIIGLMISVGEEMQIKIKGMGKKLSLTVMKSSMVEWVKKRVFEEIGVEVNLQVLVFRGQRMRSGMSLKDYNVESGAKLGLSVGNCIQVYVNIPRKIITLDVQLSITVRELRSLISKIEHVNIESFTCSGQLLDKDNMTLEEHGIRQSSLIQLENFTYITEVHANKDNSDSFVDNPSIYSS